MTLSNFQYFSSNIIGGLSGVMPWGTGSVVLAPTAWISSDEFYDQARFSHKVTTIPVSVAIIATPIISTKLLLSFVSNVLKNIPDIDNGLLSFVNNNVHPAIVLLGAGVGIGAGLSNLLINEVIMPSITDQVHKYTHPHHDINFVGETIQL